MREGCGVGLGVGLGVGVSVVHGLRRRRQAHSHSHASSPRRRRRRVAAHDGLAHLLVLVRVLLQVLVLLLLVMRESMLLPRLFSLMVLRRGVLILLLLVVVLLLLVLLWLLVVLKGVRGELNGGLKGHLRLVLPAVISLLHLQAGRLRLLLVSRVVHAAALGILPLPVPLSIPLPLPVTVAPVAIAVPLTLSIAIPLPLPVPLPLPLPLPAEASRKLNHTKATAASARRTAVNVVLGQHGGVRSRPGQQRRRVEALRRQLEGQAQRLVGIDVAEVARGLLGPRHGLTKAGEVLGWGNRHGARDAPA